MTSLELIRWSSLHDRRMRSGDASVPRLAIVVIAGAAFAAWVGSRISIDPVTASRGWLAGAIPMFAAAFLRAPFHLYWRADASLLCQLPIHGGALFDAAMWRCTRLALTTTAAAALGALPLGQISLDVLARHLAIASLLGICAALLIPAVATWAAAIVATDPRARANTSLLGAIPGFAATFVIVGIVLIAPWLAGRPPVVPVAVICGALGISALIAVVAMRHTAPRVMGAILRDVSALDRQRFATLEIGPPTAIERAILACLGASALPYGKDARLMRRRYPMAFALGTVFTGVLVILGVARPDDPAPWLTATMLGAAAYAVALARRLYRPPIELVRQAAVLPITSTDIRRAKLAWITAWWGLYVVAPALFASFRQPDPIDGLLLLGGTTIVVAASAASPPRTRATSAHP